MKFDRRLDKLEAHTPERTPFQNLQEIYDFESSEEGKAEILTLYPNSNEGN